MRIFVIGVVIGILLGLAACAAPAAAPAPTGAPTSTAEVVTQPTTPPTETSVPSTATELNAPTQAAAATEAVASTPAPTDPPAPTPTPGTVFITYQDFAILPAETTIPVGTHVTFQIKAGLLTFHQPYNFTAPNVFEAPARLGDGATFDYAFNEPGTVTLLCGYHPDMRATLIVQP